MLLFDTLVLPYTMTIYDKGNESEIQMVVEFIKFFCKEVLFFRKNTKSLPKDIIEASRIDGLNEFQIFTKIYMHTMYLIMRYHKKVEII